MNEQRKNLVAALRRAALTTPGALDAATRAASATNTLTDAHLAATALSAKIHAQAWSITPADLDSLRNAGWSEDQIFELTVAAAVGAGLHRLEVGLAAIAAASKET